MQFIFAKHNFVTDYLNADGVGDDFLKQEMITDQLAKLIFEHKPKVIKALKNNGIAMKPSASNQKVADAVIKNVEYNKTLADELQHLITRYNIFDKQLKFSADGIVDKMLKDEKTQEKLQHLMAEGISNIGIKNQTEDKGISNGDALRERIRLAEMKDAMLKVEGSKKGMSKPMVIGLITLGVIVLGTAGFLIVKSIKNKKKMSTGGGFNIAGSNGSAPSQQVNIAGDGGSAPRPTPAGTSPVAAPLM